MSTVVAERNIVLQSVAAEAQKVQMEIVMAAQAAGFSEPQLFAIRLSVEEAIVNAIKHGNGSDADKKIVIGYRVGPDAVTVRVEDQGPGFNLADVPDPTDPKYLERPDGRGIMLMRYYVGPENVRFNARGNVVEVVKRRDHKPDGVEGDS